MLPEIVLRESILLIALLIFLGFVSSILLLAFNNKRLPVWFCNKLGWHLPPKSRDFNGVNYYGKCPRCNKMVIKDSQGNWFWKLKWKPRTSSPARMAMTALGSLLRLIVESSLIHLIWLACAWWRWTTISASNERILSCQSPLPVLPATPGAARQPHP